MLFLCILISPIMNTPVYMNKQHSLNRTMETKRDRHHDLKVNRSRWFQCLCLHWYFLTIICLFVFNQCLNSICLKSMRIFIFTLRMRLLWRLMSGRLSNHSQYQPDLLEKWLCWELQCPRKIVLLPCCEGPINYHSARGFILYPRRPDHPHPTAHTTHLL